MSQDTYIDKILKWFDMQDAKKGFLLMSQGITLGKTQCPMTPDEQERMREIPYASAIGSIMYAMLCTCPASLEVEDDWMDWFANYKKFKGLTVN